MRELRPIPASEWVQWDADEQAVMATYGGAFAVIDKMLPLYEEYNKIWVLYGGRGGGKSEAVADYLVHECRTQGYFKCYYGRKVFDTVHKSCFQTLVDSIKKLGVESEFRFSEADNSTMIIRHLPTGNAFYPFGSDKPEKLKSIRNPSVIWAEEFPEFTALDFQELYPTVRKEGAKLQFLITMNAYSVYTDNWIIKTFLPESYTGQDPIQGDALVDTKVGRIFVNAPDNPFLPASYMNDLWLACAGNLTLYEGLKNGSFGIVENNAPWLHSFDEAKHVGSIPFLPAYPVHLAFDFNNDPFEVTAWQHSPALGTKDSFIHCIKEFSGSYKLDEMCDRIKASFPNSILHITGDRSGQNEDIGRNQTLYQLIAARLNIAPKLVDTFSQNLEHADSRLLCNSIIANYPSFKIDKSCISFIRQCQIATIDQKATTPSKLLKDRDIYKMDAFDSFRYYLQRYFHTYAKETYFRSSGPPKVGPLPYSQHRALPLGKR